MTHADWDNARRNRERRKSWAGRVVALVAIAALVLWFVHGGLPAGTGDHENCWTDPATGQIVQCEGDGR